MKRVIACIMIVVIAVSAAACGGSSDKAVGNYKLSGMSVMGMQIDMSNVDQEMLDMMGIASEDLDMKLEIKKDNTFSRDAMGETAEGKWSKEGDVYKMDIDGSVVDGTLSEDGKSFTLDIEGIGMTFSK